MRRILLFTLVSMMLIPHLSLNAQIQDCSGADVICNAGGVPFTPNGIGMDDFSSPNNMSGCMAGAEHESAWYVFAFSSSTPPGSTFELAITPWGGAGEDFDFAVFGPNVDCANLGSPIRCSYAASSCAFCPSTGLGMGASDLTEGAGGDGFVAPLVVNPGDVFILLIDNWLGSTNGFDMTLGGTAEPFIDCSVTPCALTVTAPADIIACQGTVTGVSLNGSYSNHTGTVTVNWTATNGGAAYLSSTTSTTPTLNIPANVFGTFVYSLEVTDADCSRTESVVVTVNANPTPPIAASDMSLCPGQTATLDAGPVYTSYLWSTTETTQTIDVNTSGTYMVTVTDFNNCVGVGTIVISNEPPVLVNITGSTTFCAGGQTTLDAGAGFSSYMWSNNTSNQTLSVSSPGTYTVTVTNAAGCTGVGGVTVTQAAALNPSISGDLTICSGDATTLDAGGGFAGYTWSTTETTQSINVSTPGVYSVTVDDGAGCTGETMVTVSTASNPTTNITGNTSICQGEMTTLDAGGGFNTYLWSTTEATQSINVTTPGTYTVTITNAENCEGVASITVNQSPPLTPSITGGLSICQGEMTMLDAGPGYNTYTWSTTENSQTISVSNPGTYTVTVTDAAGCSGTTSVTVSQNPPVAVSISGDNSICTGATSILDAGPGFASYSWSDVTFGQTTSVSTPGTYMVTVTDGNGCSGVASFTVSQAPDPVVNITGDMDFCVGESATLNAGAGYVSYNWSNAGNSQQITVFSPGPYSVTVMDAQGCTGMATVNVVQNPNPTPMITGDMEICQGSSTTLDAGFGYSSYAWSNAGGSQQITVSAPGPYTVTVTDANGCSGEATVNVSSNSLPTPGISGDMTICTGEPTVLDVTGGPYQDVIWSNFETSPTITVSTGGSYSVTVTDFNGCENVATAFVNESPPPSVSIFGDQQICPNGGTTTLDVVFAYQSILWSTTSTAQSIVVNTPGMYEVTVTDFNGCQNSTSVFVSEFPEPQPFISGDTEICEGETTTLDVGPGYSAYQWSTTEISSSIIVDQPGLYSVTVTDFNGCTAEALAFINISDAPDASITGDLSICSGGTATLTAPSGPYFYQWSTNQTTQSIDIFSPGSYSVTVSTTNGCIAENTVTVAAEPGPNPTIAGSLSFCPGGATLLDAGGGYASYDWSDGTDGQTISVNTPGTIGLTVTDANGCEGTTSVLVEELNELNPSIGGALNFCEGGNTTLDAGSGFATYLWSDNSAGQQLFVDLPGTYSVTVSNGDGCMGSTTVTVTENMLPPVSISGNLTYCEGGNTILDAGSGFSNYLWTGNTNNQTLTVSAPGTYSVTVTDANGCQNVTQVDVVEEMEPEPQISGSLSFCPGTSTTLDAGTGFDTYLWSDNSMGQTLDVSTPGTFSVTVTNASGCEGVATVQVAELAELTPTIGGALNFCEGGSTTLDAGSGFATYLWSDGSNSTTQQITVDTPGDYTVTVEDGSGCSGTATVTVSENAPPDVMITGQLSFCEGGNTVLDAGAGFASYLWSDNTNNPTITISTPGTVSVTVTDTNGCENMVSVDVSENQAPIPSISGDLSICTDSTTTLDAGAGYASYLWSDNSDGQTLDVNQTGVYGLTVTDANGCEGFANVQVDALPEPVAMISGQLDFCEGTSTTLDAGSGFDTYLWSDNSSNQQLDVSSPGDYTVVVTNAEGCSAEATVSVTETPAPALTISGDLDFCVGENTTLDAGTGFASYTWSDNSGGQTLMVDQPGNYSVVVEDANGCENTAMVMVVENALPTPQIAGSTSFCPGGSTTLDGGTGYTDYLWSDNTDGQTLTVSVIGDYGLTVTDANGCMGETMVTVDEQANLNPVITGALAFCEGGSTTLNAGSGFATYAWSTTEASQTIMVDTPGDVSVTVTDASGCMGETVVSVTENPLPTAQIDGLLTFCDGNTTILDGGTGFASYLWSDASNGQTLEVDASGDYGLTVTDANGCQAEAMVSVTEQASLDPMISGTLDFCEGESTTLDAGIGFDTYTWSTTENTQTIVVDTPGDISVTVTDASGCMGETIVTIVENSLPMPQIAGSLAFCPGTSTTLDGGAGYASYSWSDATDGQTTMINTPGDVGLTVTDANGCVGETMVTVDEEDSLTPVITGELEYCEGGSTTLDAGSGFDTYMWSTGDDTQTITVGTPDDVVVTVTDASGCTGEATVTVVENGLPMPQIAGSTTFCPGTSTTLDGGAGYASYSWSDGTDGQTTMIDTPGDVGLTVTDANGCEGETIVMVDEQDSLNPVIMGDLAFCEGDNTTLDAGGGFDTYLWSTGDDTQTITVDSPDDIGLTVTNASGCSGETVVTVVENNLPNPQISGSTTFCPGTSTTLNGGAGYASYNWSDGTDGQTTMVNTPGDVGLTVTDANGCEGETMVAVDEQDSLSPVIIGGLAFCEGGSTTLDAGDGFDTYAWSTTESTQTIVVDSPGDISVTVTDVSGCMGETIVTVTENPLPSPQISGDLSFCFGTNTTLDGGAGFASYSWTGGTDEQTLEVDMPGDVGLTVTDANGCEGEAMVSITEEAELMPVILGTPEFCATGTGFCLLEVGSIFANYLWSDGSMGQQATISTPGDVSVTVVDANGCTGEAVITVIENPLPTPAISGILNFCPGTSTTLDGGSGYAAYSWSDGTDGQTLQVDMPGDVGLTVTDTNGCEGEAIVTVEETDNLNPVVTGILEFCEGQNTTLDAGNGYATYTWSTTDNTQSIVVDTPGNISVTVTDASGCTGETMVNVVENSSPNPQIGGSLSYCPGGSTTLNGSAGFASYLWSDNSDQQTLLVDTPGNYGLTVTDANGCEGETMVTVEEQDNLNPVITGALAYCEGGSTTLDVGAGFDTYSWSTTEDTQTITVSMPGSIGVTVSDAFGCSGETTVMIVENPLPSVSISGDAEFCDGDMTTLDAGSGFASYIWSDNSNNATLDVDQTGTYVVLVTDANGCEASASFDVEVFDNPMPVIEGALSFCPGGSTMLQTIDPYSSYDWSTGSDQANIMADMPIQIDLTVTDANGCEGSTSVQLSEFATDDPIIDGVLSFCPEGNTLLSVTNSFTDYTWTGGTMGDNLAVNTPGDYGVTVTDANGCETSASVTTTNFMVEMPTITGPDAFCEGSSIDLMAEGNFTDYEWSTTENTPAITIGAGGTYSVSTTDSNGCVSESSVFVTENNLPAIVIGGSTTYCVGGSTTLSADAPDLIAFNWSTTDATQTIEVNTPGLYGVTVTDINGCENSAEVQIDEDVQLEPVVSGALNFCPGTSTTLDGGANYASYNWSTTDATQTIDVTMPGTYGLTVTDDQGCIGTTEVMVNEFPEPSVMIGGTPSFCEGNTTTLTAPAGFSSYLWSDNSNLTSLTIDTEGMVSLEVEDMNGCVATDQIFVDALPLPDFDITGDENFCSGSTASLSVPDGFANYEWSTTDMTAAISVSTGGTFDVTVTNAEGCESSESFVVEEIPLPIADAGATQTIDCVTENATLGGASTSMGLDFEYEWSGPGIDANNANDINPLVAEGGTYTFVVTNTLYGCVSAEASVIVDDLRYDPEVVLAVSDNLDCAITSVSVDGSGSSIQNNPIYEWFDEMDNPIAGEDQPVLETTEPGTYTLLITDTVTGCAAMGSIEVTQDIDYPEAEAGNPRELDCATTTATLDASGSESGANIVYEWTATNGGNIVSGDDTTMPEINMAGTFIIDVINTSNGCITTDTVIVTEDFNYPTADAGLDQQLDCKTPEVSLDGSGSSQGGSFSYSWIDEQSGAEIATSLQLPVTMPGTYTLVVLNNDNGCESIDEVLVTIDETGLNAIFSSAQSPTCFGDRDGLISIDSVGGGTAPLLYSLNGGPFNSSPVFSNLEAGTYELTVQDGTGCELITMVTVEPGNDLSVNLGDDLVIKLGDEVQLEADIPVAEDQIFSFDWSMTDSIDCPTCLTFDIMPFSTSTFFATVVDVNGCVATDEITIFVDRPDEVFIPNIFSPNDDGSNDVFMIFGGDDVLLVRKFYVFDRWGDVVFEVENVPANDPNFGWEGDYKGSDLNAAVFVYMAEIVFIDGSTKLFKGDVVLMK